VLNAQCKKNPALTIPQCQAVLDVSHLAFDRDYAAFYVHGLFGGSRVTETKKMSAKGFDPEDGVQSISAKAGENSVQLVACQHLETGSNNVKHRGTLLSDNKVYQGCRK
jgi:hypothetical protein